MKKHSQLLRVNKVTNSVSGYKEDEDMNTKMEIYICTQSAQTTIFSVMQQRRILTMNCSLSLSISHVKVRNYILAVSSNLGKSSSTGSQWWGQLC